MTTQAMPAWARRVLPKVYVYGAFVAITAGLVWLAISGDRYTRKLEIGGQTGDSKAIAECHAKAGSAFLTASGYYQGCVVPPRGRK